MDLNQNLSSAPSPKALPKPPDVPLFSPPRAGFPEENLDTPPAATKSGNSFGALFGIIVIIVVLLLGALYFWGAQLSKEAKGQPTSAGAPSF